MVWKETSRRGEAREGSCIGGHRGIPEEAISLAPSTSAKTSKAKASYVQAHSSCLTLAAAVCSSGGFKKGDYAYSALQFVATSLF